MQIEKLIEDGSFPSCVLFSGSRYSGRMYTANKVADALGSTFESTVILSDRDNVTQINAALNLFEKNRNRAASQFLERTVKVYLKQFHGALMDSMSAANRKKFSDAGGCMDLLSELASLDEKDIPKWTDRMRKSLEKLYPLSKGQGVTVGKIRDIKKWCSEYSADGKTKTVIIEGLENAGDSSSNALLKILEEPPADTYFILVSQNPGRIGQTVLSRVRQFHFSDMSTEQKNSILSSLFVDPNAHEDLESFFITMSGADDELLHRSAREVSEGKDPQFPALVKELERTGMWTRFYSLLVRELRNRLESGELSERKCSYLLEEIENHTSKAASFNQVPRLTFDFVVFTALGVVR